MSDAIAVFLLTLSALFPIVDPLAGSPLFLAMTQEYSPQTRRALAWRVALNSLLLMVGSYFVGAHVLNFFGVSLPVVQIGGGLVVVSMGWSILLLIAMTVVAISILLCYGLADQLARVIGKTGMIVIVRLSSFLLVCIGVQIMWNGLSALLSTLHI